jgi:hypothetical protein
MLTKGAAIKCNGNDEHFLRRLGGAVIVHWDELPKGTRDLLIEQAALMLDRTQIVGATFEIEQFIDAHKGGDI